MIENITYQDAEQERDINAYVGRSYTFWESLRMGGTGSQRLTILDHNPVFDEFLSLGTGTKKCNIELRKLGIGIRFRYRLETMGWFVPFQNIKLEFEENTVKITDHTTGVWLHLTPSNRSKLNHRFFDNLTKPA